MRGQVCRAGRPLTGYGVSFLALAPGRDPEESDWDFTDEEGRYEVELRAARYVVRDENGTDVTAAVVLTDGKEFSLDIDLGPARRGL